MMLTLLVIHIIAGIATLFAAFAAITSKFIDFSHRWHVYSGRIYFWDMPGIFVTALAMSLIRVNPPMLFVSII